VSKPIKLSLSLFILILLVIPTSAAAADIGPKPTMDFSFEYQTSEPLTIVEGVLLQCEDPECLEAYPLEQLGPQDFTCTTEGCTSMAYGYTGDNQLVITFSDGVTRHSNLFGKQNFNAEYTVTVYQDDLLVQETGGSKYNPMGVFFAVLIGLAILAGLLLVVLLIGLIVLIMRGGREEPLGESSHRWIITIWVIGVLFFFGSLILAATGFSSWPLPLTILIEGTLLAIYTTYRKQPRLIPLTLNLTGNLVTQLVLWFMLTNSNPGGMGWILFLLAEAVIVFIEAAILYWPQPSQITIKQALSISLILNLVSVTIGLLLPI
jgi:hypothetical protein